MSGSRRKLVSTATDHNMIILPFSISLGEKEIRLFMNVQKISHVADFHDLSPLPDSHRPFIGLYSWGDIPIPAIDLNEYFHKNPMHDLDVKKNEVSDQKVQNRRILICSSMNSYIGLIVDRTRKIEAIENNAILAPPAFLKQGIFCAVMRDESGFRYLLDIESLLEKEGVHLGTQNLFDSSEKSLLKGRRILFVDDSKYFQSLGRKLLEKFSAIVDVAGDGQEALEKFNTTTKSYDLILTDIEMPLMSGIEMAKIVRKVNGSDIPIVFHSSISNMALIEELKRDGIGDYIVKFDEKSVIEAILKHVDSLERRESVAS